MSDSIILEQEKDWDIVINPKKRGVSLNFGELWRYRDLMMLFVKKDIVTVYKQTVLGPLWFFLQPIFTTIIFYFLFGKIAGMSPEGIPEFPFYLLGITLWSYFAEILTITSKTFTDNASVFGKVYFPRLIIPISKVMSGFAKFVIQFSLFFVLFIYHVFVSHKITPDWHIILAPVILLIVVVFSLGCGILITALTTKYRDMSFLVTFGVQLLMYGTPVAYTLVNPKFEKYKHILLLNPLTSLFEAFKAGFFGRGYINYNWLLYSVVVTIVVLIFGILSFNKVEKRFIDTV